MKANIIVISNLELTNLNKNESLNYITSSLLKNGFEVGSYSVVSVDYDLIFSAIKNSFNKDEITLIAVENELDAMFLTKKTISTLFEEEIIVNEFAKTQILNYFKIKNLPVIKEANSYAQMPISARCIANSVGFIQGFLISKFQKTLVYMPLEKLSLKEMFKFSVLPYLLEKTTNNNKVYVLKTFGLTHQEIIYSLKDLIKNKHKIKIVCNENLLDAEIIILYDPKTKQEIVENFISTIFSRLSANIYAENDCSIFERAFDLLNLNKKTLTIAEDISVGNFSAKFFEQNDLAKNILLESYFVPTNDSKIKNLGVDASLFVNENVDFEEVAYQMALGALENARTDIVISTAGNLEQGICYIGIGSVSGIHVYKKVVGGTLSEKIEKITYATFFQLIKKIKQNDFHLSQTTV